jgi:hypothetical protein
MRALRWILAIAVAAALVSILAVGASAALDAPSRTSTTATVIDAPRERVWDIVTDFASYPAWNPYLTEISGAQRAGESLDIVLATPDHGSRAITATIYVLRPPRKLRWQSRTLVPGLRDLEYEIIVAPLGPDRSQVQQRARYEGLLAVFVDEEATSVGLERMAAALAHRAEAGT